MRFLHTMLRVRDLEKSKAFYTDILDMKVLREIEIPEGRFTLVFVGYGHESENTVLELTYNWDVKDYEMGSAYGHIAIGYDDVYAACEIIRKRGGKIIREPGPMKGNSSILAFVEDPDGYKVELLENKAVSRRG